MTNDELFDQHVDKVWHKKDDHHFIGESLSIPTSVSNVGAASVGTSPVPARQDHVHGGGSDVTFSYNGAVSSIDTSPKYPMRGSGTILEVVVVAKVATTTGALGLKFWLGGTSYDIDLPQGDTFNTVSINVSYTNDTLIYAEVDDIADGLCEDLSITVRCS